MIRKNPKKPKLHKQKPNLKMRNYLENNGKKIERRNHILKMKPHFKIIKPLKQISLDFNLLVLNLNNFKIKIMMDFKRVVAVVEAEVEDTQVVKGKVKTNINNKEAVVEEVVDMVIEIISLIMNKKEKVKTNINNKEDVALVVEEVVDMVIEIFLRLNKKLSLNGILLPLLNNQ